MLELRSLVEEKFAATGKLSEYLSEIAGTRKQDEKDLGQKLKVKLEEIAKLSRDSWAETEEEPKLFNDSAMSSGLKSGSGAASPKAGASFAPNNTPITTETESAADLTSLLALNEALRGELSTLRHSYEQQTKDLAEQRSNLLVLKQEKLQAELCRDSAQGRLDGLIQVLNNSKRCNNTGCQVSLNVAVLEHEVRTKGNIIIRCRTCNARQR
ncbi:hypothetical protein ABW19_dt0205365 [Dactylella cylindrospora]|nr:hypothetical protein ABW19_dt0205365 [Dactylella cylindrospora]